MKYVLSHLQRGLRLRFWMTLLMTAGLCFQVFSSPYYKICNKEAYFTKDITMN